MCAEELTNQVLYMRNVPAAERDIWMTFEAIEDGELGEGIQPFALKAEVKPLNAMFGNQTESRTLNYFTFHLIMSLGLY